MNSRKLGYGIFDSATKIIFIVVVVLIIVGGAKTAYYYGYHLFNQTAVDEGEGEGKTVSVTIEDGDSAETIAEKLADEGLIKDKKLFKMQEKFSEYKGKEKAGTYELTTKMTPEEMLATIAGYVKDEDGKYVEAASDASLDPDGNIKDVDGAYEDLAPEDEGGGEEEAEAVEAEGEEKEE
ncbi:MAG: endolytic transglycosylase MltG [Butyrivibrio sp.]|nr:endolytic transglycosylase MltG [Butyrivibrio sp.]